MSLPVHLIIPTTRLSGAEKRFLSFWLYSQQHREREFFLVTTEDLYKQAAESDEFADIVNYGPKIIYIDSSEKKSESIKIVRHHLFKYREKAIMHFALWYPVNLSLRRFRTLYTFPGYDLSYLSLAKKAVLYLSFLRSTKSDILDPIIFEKLRKYFFVKRESFTLTPNSVVNLEKYKADFSSKENWIVFLGRFIGHKQVIPFAKCIPAIHKMLQAKGVGGIKFYLLGSGEQENELSELLKNEEYNGIDIFVGFVSNPQAILERSKIILSVQEYNNYPSRSLLEAMACGNIPVVTNVGNTDLIAKPEFSVYMKRNFDEQEIATAITSILSMEEDPQRDQMSKARQFVADNCKMENMADYFFKLYDEMQSK